MQLAYRFCDDWLIYAQAADGSWWTANTETWPEWADLADEHGVPAGAIGTGPGDVERYMVPLVTAWDSALSPTVNLVSRPTGLTWACWERVPDKDTAGLHAHAADLTTATAPGRQAIMTDTLRVFILPEGSGRGWQSAGRGTVYLPVSGTPEYQGRLSTLVLRDGAAGSTFIPLDRLTLHAPDAYRRAWGSPPPTLAEHPHTRRRGSR